MIECGCSDEEIVLYLNPFWSPFGQKVCKKGHIFKR